MIRSLSRLAARRGARSFSVVSAASADYDVVVVGSGAVGASTAYHLALHHPEKRVCVVEKDPTFEFCSAMLSAGGVRQQFSLISNIELSMYGAEFIKNAHKDLAVPGDDPPDLQFKEQGYLFLASPDGEQILRYQVPSRSTRWLEFASFTQRLQMRRDNNATQKACGVDWTTLLSPAELTLKFPWLNVYAGDCIALGAYGEHSEGCV